MGLPLPFARASGWFLRADRKVARSYWDCAPGSVSCGLRFATTRCSIVFLGRIAFRLPLAIAIFWPPLAAVGTTLPVVLVTRPALGARPVLRGIQDTPPSCTGAAVHDDLHEASRTYVRLRGQKKKGARVSQSSSYRRTPLGSSSRPSLAGTDDRNEPRAGAKRDIKGCAEPPPVQASTKHAPKGA